MRQFTVILRVTVGKTLLTYNEESVQNEIKAIFEGYALRIDKVVAIEMRPEGGHE